MMLRPLASLLGILLLAYTAHAGGAPLLDHAMEDDYTHVVHLDVDIGDKYAGRIIIGLYGHVVPKTVENFMGLASNKMSLTFKGSIFHRVIQ
jgi:hypothetical protein